VAVMAEEIGNSNAVWRCVMLEAWKINLDMIEYTTGPRLTVSISKWLNTICV
jgi:hypothetical protein